MILSKPLLHCRLEWRPSRILEFVLLVLMLLAILSVAISALALYLVIPLCLLILCGTALQIRKYRRSPYCSLFWRAGDDCISLNFGHQTESLVQPRCHQQGPLWIISALDECRQNRYFVFLPDTLTRSEQRLLRLVAATPLTLD
ncbi:MAG: hypothetical protein ABIP02_09485 [Arenimonas sp.]